MKKNPIYIMGGIGLSFAHPHIARLAKQQEQNLIDKRRRELEEQNEAARGRMKRIDVKEFISQLGEPRKKKFYDKPDSIPCPKPYRRRR